MTLPSTHVCFQWFLFVWNSSELCFAMHRIEKNSRFWNENFPNSPTSHESSVENNTYEIKTAIAQRAKIKLWRISLIDINWSRWIFWAEDVWKKIKKKLNLNTDEKKVSVCMELSAFMSLRRWIKCKSSVFGYCFEQWKTIAVGCSGSK